MGLREPSWPLGLVVYVLLGTGCAGSSSPDLSGAPTVRGPDGRDYRLLAKGGYKAYYDAVGRLDHLEYDSKGDGKPDHFVFYDGFTSPRRMEVDTQRSGHVDRWEAYDDGGRLVSVGTSRRHGSRPDVWTFPGPKGEIQRVEIDSDGDGRVDRWQSWRGSHLVSEDIDTDGDGRPDHRLRYDESGKVVSIEALH